MNLMNIEQNAENLRLLGLIVAQRGSRFRGSGGVIAP